jgi:hypothetical protein
MIPEQEIPIASDCRIDDGDAKVGKLREAG